MALEIEKGHKRGSICKLSNFKQKNTLRFERIIQALPVQVCSSYPYPSVQ